MRRVVRGVVLGLLLVIQSGCIAVSAKEIHSGMRYEAVAGRDGKLYVVDKEDLTAREVTIVVGSEDAEP
jgi:hypothetical protein